MTSDNCEETWILKPNHGCISSNSAVALGCKVCFLPKYKKINIILCDFNHNLWQNAHLIWHAICYAIKYYNNYIYCMQIHNSFFIISKALNAWHSIAISYIDCPISAFNHIPSHAVAWQTQSKNYN